MNSFFDGITALDLLGGVSGVFVSKEQEKTKRALAEANTRELAQTARLEKARLEQQEKLIASENARKSITTGEFLQMGKWMTLAFAGSLVLLAFGKARRG